MVNRYLPVLKRSEFSLFSEVILLSVRAIILHHCTHLCLLPTTVALDQTFSHVGCPYLLVDITFIIGEAAGIGRANGRWAGGPGGDIFEILLVCFPYYPLIALSLHLVYYGLGGINLILQYSSGDCNFLLCGSHRP